MSAEKHTHECLSPFPKGLLSRLTRLQGEREGATQSNIYIRSLAELGPEPCSSKSSLSCPSAKTCCIHHLQIQIVGLDPDVNYSMILEVSRSQALTRCLHCLDNMMDAKTGGHTHWHKDILTVKQRENGRQKSLPWSSVPSLETKFQGIIKKLEATWPAFFS